MSLGEVRTEIQDGALGLSQQEFSAIHAKVGICSSGDVNTIRLYTRPRDVKSRLGTGPLVEAGAFHIARSNKGAYLCRIDGSVAGTTSSITKSRSGSPTIVLSGAPRDTYQGRIQFTQAGTVGSGTGSGAIVYSVDGDDSESHEIAIPAGSVDVAVVTGTADLTASGLYGGGGTLNSTGFSVNSTQVTFTAPANAAAVASAINTAVGSSIATINSNNRLVLTHGTSVVLATGSPSGALALLGLTAGTTNATPGTATYALGDTGLTATFPQGSYEADDTYTFTTTEPSYTLSDLQDALDVFLSNHQIQWFCLHVVGSPATEEDARAMAELLKTYAEDFEALHRFMYFVMETAADSDPDTLEEEFAGFESTRVAVSFGHLELTSEATRDGALKRVFSRPAAWPIVARWASIPISEKAAWVGRGALPGVSSVDQATLDAAEQMSDERFLAVREVIGKAGYYVADDVMMAPAGSDFSLVPYRRIMDVACRVARAKLLNYLHANILVQEGTGYIVESVARAIEDDVNVALEAELVATRPQQHATSARMVLTRDNDILSTQELLAETRIIPPGYAKDIVHTIGFINPTVTTAA
ncbi:DUF2586 family protein [Sorangium sp. So ce388]|uniref:DUF2586 family protein n=1 Tax=Sorangium sp. So ce388 TaxID=3133309 RepID=UPI003F5B0BE0